MVVEKKFIIIIIIIISSSETSGTVFTNICFEKPPPSLQSCVVQEVMTVTLLLIVLLAPNLEVTGVATYDVTVLPARLPSISTSMCYVEGIGREAFDLGHQSLRPDFIFPVLPKLCEEGQVIRWDGFR